MVKQHINLYNSIKEVIEFNTKLVPDLRRTQKSERRRFSKNSRQSKLNKRALAGLPFIMSVFSLALLISLPTQAGDYPAKPFNYIVPFSPGGTTGQSL